MFRLLNKSAIWHLCQCVNNWLRNSSKWPFTGAVLQSASRCNTPVPWADHRGRAWDARTWWSARVHGRLVGRSVGWYQISYAIQVRRFTWATRIPSSGQC